MVDSVVALLLSHPVLDKSQNYERDVIILAVNKELLSLFILVFAN